MAVTYDTFCDYQILTFFSKSVTSGSGNGTAVRPGPFNPDSVIYALVALGKI